MVGHRSDFVVFRREGERFLAFVARDVIRHPIANLLASDLTLGFLYSTLCLPSHDDGVCQLLHCQSRKDV